MTFKGYLLLFGGVIIWLIALFWFLSRLQTLNKKTRELCQRLEKIIGDREKGT